MKRLELLDYTRFFAAIFVVLYHYTFNGILNGKISSIEYIPSLIAFTKYGYLGVEVFFMISGYVIFYSARKGSASKFIVSRARRLYPAYWFAVIFTSSFALFWGGHLMSVYTSQIVANLTMLQHFVGIDHVDGVYWTLVYEVKFYFAVFIILLLGLQKYIKILFIMWPTLFIFAYIFDLQSSPYLGNYFYYFSAGTLFAILKEQRNWRTVLSLLVTFLLCLEFSCSKAIILSQTKGIAFSPLVIGSIVSLFFLVFLYQNTKQGQMLKLPCSKTAGNLTYPIYLIHAHFGYMLISQFGNEQNKFIVYFVTILIVIAIAIFINKVIEGKMSMIWKKLFESTLGQSIYYLHRLPAKLKGLTKLG